MKKPQRIPLAQFEATPFDAKEAIRDGEEAPIAEYMRALAEAIDLVASEFGPSAKASRSKASRPSNAKRTLTISPSEAEWDASLDQFLGAWRHGSKGSIANYLHEASDVLRQVATTLDPPSESRGWRLTFCRRGRGRRTDKLEQDWKRSGLKMKLMAETRKAGKQESAIAALKKEASRATIFRAKQGKKKSHKKP